LVDAPYQKQFQISRQQKMMDDLNDEKPIEIKKYVEIAARRRWWLLGPLFGFGLIAFGIALLWPPVYQSAALILVEQQKVPTKYVTPNVVSDVDSRLQSMTQQILSRTRLESLIKQFNLYSRQRSHLMMDELVDKMRGDITIQQAQAVGRDDQTTAFRIFFSAEDPHLAQQVNTELTSLFIEKSLETRAQQSISTTNFLQSQLEQARKDLTSQEEQLRQYKMRYLGELPQQEQSNLQILNSLEGQLQSITESIARAEQQRIYLQSLRSEYQAMAQAAANGASNVPERGASIADNALHDLRRQLAELQAKYTPHHPDVLRTKEQIAQWEKVKKRTEDSSAAAQTGTGDSLASADSVNQPALAEVDSRLKAIEAEIANSKQQADKIRKQSADVQSRLSLTPVREQQLAEVTRNYQNSRENYQSLLQKELESELASNLEKRQQGEQFRIIDPPNFPDKPFKPNRPLILLGGWVLGFCVGLGAAAAREFADGSLRSESELLAETKIPVLTRIPVLYTAQERRSRKLHGMIEIAAVALMFLVSLAVAVYTYRMS
jgi:succinoglycan biosynthesis transport protein ExoP